MSNKSLRRNELFIVDMFVAIAKIKEYCQNFQNADALQYSSLHWDATIRELIILGDSLNHLLNDEEFSQMTPSYFRKIVNFRNMIVHEYFGIDADEVWNVVTIKLDKFLEDLIIVTQNINLCKAIESQIKEYKKIKNHTIVAYLQSLYEEKK